MKQSLARILETTPDEGSGVLEHGHVDLVQLENIVKYTKDQIKKLAMQKRKFAFTDKAVCMTVFDELKLKDAELKR